jgi:hypothetical protein
MFVALFCSGPMHTDWLDHSICHVSTVSNGFRLRVDIPPAEPSLAFQNQGAKKLIGLDIGSAHACNSVEVLVRTEDMLESLGQAKVCLLG